jgi:diacylglycerol kinase (ATP)
VVNGHASGVGDRDVLLRDIGTVLPGAAVRFTESLDDLYEALAERPRVVLVGGDGSLHAALNAPLGLLPELALVPAGSANNVARALGIPVERRAALRTAAAAPAFALDALRVETRSATLRALEGVSAGLQADARSRYHADNSGDLLRGAAALAVTLARFDPPEATVTVDGVERHSGPLAQVFLSNLPYFGPGFHVSPHADPSDGRLDVVGFEPAGRARMLRQLARVRRGDHLGDRGVWTERGREAAVDGELPVVADSVPLGSGPVTVTVERGRLRIAAPGARP